MIKNNKPVMELIKDSMKKDLNSPLSLNNLSFKKTFIGEWKNFFTFVILMFLTWGYFHDTAECRELIENKEVVCADYQCKIINSNSLLAYDETWKNNKSGVASFIPPNS